FHLDKLHDLIKKVKKDKWEETFEAPFISDTLKKVTKFYVESDIKKDVGKLLKEFKKIKTEEEIIQELNEHLNDASINKLLEIKK
ncbi:2533_t:CDS:1, partial [Racocetra fulgida]